MRSSIGEALATNSPAALRVTVTLWSWPSPNTLTRIGSIRLARITDGTSVTCTSWPGCSAPSDSALRAASVMARACQVSAPRRSRMRARVSPRTALTTRTSPPGEIVGGVLGLQHRLGQHGRVGRGRLGGASARGKRIAAR